MISSMTAYANHTQQIGCGQWTWELRSVNHRYLDVQLRLPDAFKVLESKLRELSKKHVQRGKLECQLRWKASQSSASKLDSQQLEHLAQLFSVLQQQLPQLRQPTTLDVLQWPGVLHEGSAVIEGLHEAMINSFEQALAQLTQARAREGKALAEFVLQRLQAVEQQQQIVRQAQPEIIARLQQKLSQKIQPIIDKMDVDNGRLEQELALHMQRLDVEEELDRIQAHVAEVRRIFDKGGACGRRLDFMMQELNREANTLSSKAAATSVVQAGVELKVLIEQMREQIQNIE